MAESKAGTGWVSPGVVRGVREVKCESWAGFIDFCTSATIKMPNYVYRGQSNANWRLYPSLHRLLIQKIKEGQPSKDREIIKNHLAKFKYSTRGRLLTADRNALSDDDWWAIGQHHGLATPLLDWSLSPFVAAFFAFSDKSEIERESDQVAVYGLSRSAVERFNRKIPSDYDKIKFVEPERDDNPRLVSQRGLFTKYLSIKSVEDWVMENASQNSKGGSLLKILIPYTEANQALLSLNRMNINYSSLFPDLYGACEHSNMSLEIEKYE